MKSTLKVLALLAVTTTFSSAATILVGNYVDTSLSANGALLDTTFTAKIGFLADGRILSTTDDFSSIITSWTNAGDIAVSSSAEAGYFDGAVNFTDALGLAGKNVFVWITNGSDANLVLRSTNTSFLADSAIPNSNSATIEAGSIGTTFQVLLGTYDAQAANPNGGGTLNLNVVPEPSALLLGALGALGLLRRRRN